MKEAEENTDIGFECSINDVGMWRSRAAEQQLDNGAVDDSSSITSSSGGSSRSTPHGQLKLCMSKKFMFALLSACVVIFVGAYVSINTHNAATDGDSLKAAMVSMIVEDGADTITTQDQPPPSPLDGDNTAQNNGCEEEDEKWLRLELTTDNAGNETSWVLERMGGGEWRTFSVSKPHDSMQQYVIRMCIPPAEYRFIIHDAGNDGLCCGNGFGSYAGYLRGAKIFESPEGGEDWGERVHTFELPAKESTEESTAGTITVVPSTSPTTLPITPPPTKASILVTAPPTTSTPSIPPTQESAPPTLSSAEVGTLTPSPTNPVSSSSSMEPSQVSTDERSNSPSLDPTAKPSSSPSLAPTTEPTNPPSPMPTPVPTTEPTNPPPLPTPPPTMRSPPPTPPPTALPLPTEDTITKFFLVADTPYSDKERYTLMPNHIAQLEDDGDFIVHLGDLMYAVKDRCREGAYSIAAQILSTAKMPTFVLPGDNDINDCPSIQHGEDMWMKYFHLFDKKHWNHSFDVTRWGKLNESFGFVHKRVLFLGLNMVGGTPYDWTEKANRHREHLEQVKALFNAHEGKFDVVVLMKHAIPRYPHSDFFGNGSGDGLFIDMIKQLGKPTIHLHGDWHSYYERDGEYGIDNYVRISLDGESSAPPLSVTIDVSKPNPITVTRRQSNLKVNCCANGWPRQ
ncbi:hypothetical protein ACHAWT_008860 [Skeletonema menzelii]